MPNVSSQNLMVELSSRKILVTGSAGFIGFHLAKRLLSSGAEILGIDNINDFYAPSLKQDRLKGLTEFPNFRFVKLDLNSPELISAVENFAPTAVYHLAAQANVRYSLTHPMAYVDSNLSGLVKVLEALRKVPPRHFIFASSSSVYGKNSKVPFSVEDRVDHPVSLYAASKRAGELICHSYSHLFQIPTTCLRFFTVYGSWGRPDMAYFLFADKIAKGDTIELFNHGKMQRDFTHISDIVESLVRLMDKYPQEDSESRAPFRILNIGASSPVELGRFVQILENLMGKKARIQLREMQPGDVPATYADVEALEKVTGYRPRVSIEEGLKEFVDWFKSYYRIDS